MGLYGIAVAAGGFGARWHRPVSARVAGIRGPGGNVVTAGRGAAFVNGQFVGGKAWTAVNGAYTRWAHSRPAGTAAIPAPGGRASGPVAATAWGWWGLGAPAGGYCGCSGEGCYYDYGGNVTYEGDTVYYGDEAVATAEQYYDQAEQIAESHQNEDGDQSAKTRSGCPWACSR